MCFGLPPWTTSARCVRMYRTAGNLAVRSGVTKMPLMTTWHLCAARAGSRPVNAVPTKVAFTRQSFAIAFAMSMSNPTGLPLVVFDSIGGKLGSLQYLRDPFTGEVTWELAPPVPTTTSAVATRASRDRTLTTRLIAPSSLAWGEPRRWSAQSNLTAR